MRHATCADTQISIEWPYCSFPILWCSHASEDGQTCDFTPIKKQEAFTVKTLRMNFVFTLIIQEYEGNTTDIKPNCKLKLVDVKNGRLAGMDWV